MNATPPRTSDKAAEPGSREPLAEFTFQAVLTGIVLGIVFGAANTYMGLRVGMTVSASIPAAVMTVAVFAAFGRKVTILEANLSQTVASASTALATGSLFTLPALFLWGVIPPYMQIVGLCFLGGLLGLAAMIPLRRLLIVQSHDELPYPEGTACAEVLLATTRGVRGAGWIFAGMGVGAGVKVLTGLLYLVPDKLVVPLSFLSRAELAMELGPALIGVGFLLGYRQSAVCVAGSLLSSLALIPLIAWFGNGLTAPLPPETQQLIANMSSAEIWTKYIRYIGAGAVATAGILTVLRGLPAMGAAFLAVARGMRRDCTHLAPRDVGNHAERDEYHVASTERDLPGIFIILAIVTVALAAVLVPGLLAADLGFMPRVVAMFAIALFGMLFVTVTARIVGIVGVSSQPTSGITLVTLLGTAALFTAAGWTDGKSQIAVLTVGTIVAIAASKSGDISQDLKTGFLVGATPAKQQFGQLLGAATACWAVAGTLTLLGNVYGFGGDMLPAPQATLMKTIIEGVFTGKLPWRLVYSGGGVALCGMLCGANGLAFAIGVYLPLATMAPLYIGGCARALADRFRRGRPASEGDAGVLAASGLVAGEGLAGVLVAGLVASKLVPASHAAIVPGLWGQVAVVTLTILIGFFLLRACRIRT